MPGALKSTASLQSNAESGIGDRCAGEHGLRIGDTRKKGGPIGAAKFREETSKNSTAEAGCSPMLAARGRRRKRLLCSAP